MTLVNAQAGVEMSRCGKCGHDLFVPGRKGKQTSGDVHCSNRKCTYHRKAHPMSSSLNEGPVKA